MFDDEDLEHLEDLIDRARSKLAKTAGYLPDDISGSLQDLLNHVDEFRDEIIAAADEEDDGDGADDDDGADADDDAA